VSLDTHGWQDGRLSGQVCYCGDSCVLTVTNNQITCLDSSVLSSLYPESSHEYLSSFPEPISIEKLWNEMDRVWLDCLKKHKSKFTDAFFAEYYSHPVWCLNSVFSSVDPESVRNREALIRAITSLEVKTVSDMGGGYGVFLQMLKQKCPDLKVILCEPYLSEQIESELSNKEINVSRQVPEQVDAYIFIDVLEHLVEPLSYLHNILKVASSNSYFIFGNCFHPVIKCHLPSTFYLRHTFPLASRLMGLTFIGNVKNAEYMQIYRRKSNSSLNPRIVAIIARIISLLIYPYAIVIRIARKFKRVARRIIGVG